MKKNKLPTNFIDYFVVVGNDDFTTLFSEKNYLDKGKLNFIIKFLKKKIEEDIENIELKAHIIDQYPNTNIEEKNTIPNDFYIVINLYYYWKFYLIVLFSDWLSYFKKKKYTFNSTT